MAVSGLVDDFDKDNRPQGGGYEVGADETGPGGGGGQGPGGLSWLLLLMGR